MAINVAIDDKLLNDAQRLGQHNTKLETVCAALTEYVSRRNQLKITELFGQIEYYCDYDYKQFRKRL